MKLSSIFSGMLVLGLVVGCETTDLRRVASDTMSGAMSEAFGGMGSPVATSTTSGSVEANKVSIVEAERTSRDLGSISVVKRAKNPEEQTKIVLEGCEHPRIGKLRCGGYIFEINSEGWLVDSPISFDDLNNPSVVVPAGIYYLKFYNWDTGQDRFATGEFKVQPFVSNHVYIELE